MDQISDGIENWNAYEKTRTNLIWFVFAIPPNLFCALQILDPIFDLHTRTFFDSILYRSPANPLEVRKFHKFNLIDLHCKCVHFTVFDSSTQNQFINTNEFHT